MRNNYDQRPPKVSHIEKMLGLLGGLNQLDEQELTNAHLAQGVQSANNLEKYKNLEGIADVGKSLSFTSPDAGAEMLEFVGKQYGFRPDANRALAQKAASEGMTIEQYQALLEKLGVSKQKTN